MNIKRLFSVTFACLAIAACTAPAAGCTTTGPGGTQTISATTDEKAMFVAESAFRGALITVNAALDSGELKGEDAAAVSRHLADAKAALDVARAAYAAGDSLGAITAADRVTTSVGAIGPLTSP